MIVVSTAHEGMFVAPKAVYILVCARVNADRRMTCAETMTDCVFWAGTSWVRSSWLQQVRFVASKIAADGFSFEFGRFPRDLVISSSHVVIS